jgi:flagella basal body P-ring formation protein FlgA
MIWKKFISTCLVSSTIIVLLNTQSLAEKRPINEFTEASIKETITQLVLKQFPQHKSNEVSVELKNWDHVLIAKKNFEFFEINYEIPETYLGNILLELQFSNKEAKTKPEHYKLHSETTLCTTAYKTNKKIDKHAIIREEDLETFNTCLNSDTNQYILAKNAIIGKQTKYTVYKDSIASQKWVESIPDIKKGETVSIRILDDGFSIESQAEALDSGFIGEKIRIKLMMSKKIIMAKIVDGENISDKTQKIVVLAN